MVMDFKGVGGIGAEAMTRGQWQARQDALGRPVSWAPQLSHSTAVNATPMTRSSTAPAPRRAPPPVERVKVPGSHVRYGLRHGFDGDGYEARCELLEVAWHPAVAAIMAHEDVTRGRSQPRYTDPL